MRRPGLSWIIVALLLVSLAACGSFWNSTTTLFVPADKERAARTYIDELRRHDFPPIERDLDPALVTPDLPATLDQLSSLFPKENPKSIKVVGSQTFSTTDKTDYTINY